ncbi:MAG: hypothetical protein K8E66_09980, partial [Phycisphaerales bacterium]|nr:hypothetical protein [Phycisphaerales bacterium]
AGAMDDFRREFPNRFYNIGIAEQAMTGIAAGLAQRGFKVLIYTIATFALFRNYEFIRCDLAYQNLPVTIVGMGAGLAYPTLGGTHQAIEDVAVAMACPNLTVLVPCDPAETAACVRWCAARESGGPVYMRIGKAGEPDLTKVLSPWEFGRMRWWRYSSTADLALLSYGPITAAVHVVADALEGRGLVANGACVPTLSEFHEEDLQRLRGTRVVTIEEASGAPLASALRSILGVRVESFCLPRDFPHAYGTRAELLDTAGLSVEKIAAALSGGR